MAAYRSPKPLVKVRILGGMPILLGVNYELGNFKQDTRKRNPRMDLDV